MKRFLALAVLLPLAGCTVSTVQSGLAAMQANHVDGCLSATASVAGYMGTASGCVNGSQNGSTVNADNGKVIMQRNGEAAPAPDNNPPVAQPLAAAPPR